MLHGDANSCSNIHLCCIADHLSVGSGGMCITKFPASIQLRMDTGPLSGPALSSLLNQADPMVCSLLKPWSRMFPDSFYPEIVVRIDP